MTLQSDNWIYLSHRDFRSDLLTELHSVKLDQGPLIFAKAGQSAIWAQDIWRSPQFVQFESIGQASKTLKAIKGVKWKLIPTEHHRRAHLIASRIDTWPDDFRIESFEAKLSKKVGCFALIGQNQLVYSLDVNQDAPAGLFEFEENKTEPPNRAYLKLWEVFYRYGIWPDQNDICLEIGSAPGGWTWVLSPLCQKVISVDKANLDPKVSALVNVDHRIESAFSLRPEDFPEVSWLFSDVICYPEKMLGLVRKWMEASNVAHFVITVKLQGETDFKIIKEFQSITGSSLVHLYHNKHELTFVLNRQPK